MSAHRGAIGIIAYSLEANTRRAGSTRLRDRKFASNRRAKAFGVLQVVAHAQIDGENREKTGDQVLNFTN